MTLYHEPRPDRARTLAMGLTGDARPAADLAELAAFVRADPNEQLVIIGASVDRAAALAFAAAHRLTRPSLGATATVVIVPNAAPPIPPEPWLRSGLITVQEAAASVDRLSRLPP